MSPLHQLSDSKLESLNGERGRDDVSVTGPPPTPGALASLSKYNKRKRNKANKKKRNKPEIKEENVTVCVSNVVFV